MALIPYVSNPPASVKAPGQLMASVPHHAAAPGPKGAAPIPPAAASTAAKRIAAAGRDRARAAVTPEAAPAIIYLPAPPKAALAAGKIHPSPDDGQSKEACQNADDARQAGKTEVSVSAC